MAKTAVEARKWVQEAIREGHYTPVPHVRDRLKERGMTMNDLFHALNHPSTVEPYPAMPEHGGTCWRFIGQGLDTQAKIAVGVELYLNEQQRWAILVTIFPAKGAKR